MGKAISYCYKCSSLLREDDFLKGKAFRDGNRIVCAACAPDLRDSTTKFPAPTSSSTKTPRLSTSTRIPAVHRSIPSPEDFEVARRRSRTPLLFGVAGLVGVLAVLLVVASGKKKDPAPELVPENPEPPVALPADNRKPPKTAERPPEEVLLEQARKFAADHPGDLAGQQKGFEKLVWGDFEKTRAAAEARKEIDSIKARIGEKVRSEMAKLEEEVKEPLRKEAFGQAIKALENAGKRLEYSEWSLATAKRVREVSEQAGILCDDLSRQAGALAAQGKAAEAQELVKRVRGWEMPVFSARIEKSVSDAAGEAPAESLKAALPVEKKPRTEEGKSYLAKWQEAMGRVASRDYDGALGELRRASQGLKEQETQAEAKSDIDDVDRLKTLLKETIDPLVAKPRITLSVELRDGRKLAGRVIGIDADRVMLFSKQPAFAEWSEVSPRSIVALSGREKKEPRLLALFCLAEGDLESAMDLLGATLESVAAKYWAWAPEAKLKISKPEPLELAARELFYAAERDYLSMSTRGLAVEKYRSLRKECGTSSLVRKVGDRIDGRAEACQNYYFAAADLDRAGTLKLTKTGTLESDADSDGFQANQNWAEVEFYVLPGATYRAWVHAGGCCQEVFDFYWQATELTAVHPKTKKSASADIGAALAPEVRNSIRNLKARHDPKTPKAPTRWEWIELPLPKYAGPGPKRLRLMTDQKGFAIGALVISCSRKLPPKEEELKDLEKARLAELPPLLVDPDLVAWYPLDDGQGGSVTDAAGGHAGKILGNPKWIDGKVAGALELDGQTHASADDAEDLRLTGDLTIAFWMKKDAPAGGWQRMVGKGAGLKRNYGCWTGGGSDRVLFQQYAQDERVVINIQTQNAVQIGKWHHFAATVEGTKATLYLDGVKEGGGIRSGTPATSSDPLNLGFCPDHPRFIGALDDVRIYRRALSSEEVRVLFEMGK